MIPKRTAIELWIDPRDGTELATIMDRILGPDQWVGVAPEAALLGLFMRPDTPSDLDPFMPLIGLHPELVASPSGAWLQKLSNPDDETLRDAIENLATMRQMEIYDRAIFEALREHSNDSIYVLDDRGFFVFVNRSFQELMRLSFEEICSPEFEFGRLVAPAGQPVIAAREAAHREGLEPPPQYEFEASDSRGRFFPVQVSTARIRFRGSICTLGILRDISEQKDIQHALKRQNRALSIRNKIATIVNQGVHLDAVLDLTLQVLADNLHFDAFLATEAQARDGLYRVAAQRGMPQTICADLTQQQAYEVPSEAKISGRSIVFPDLRDANSEAPLIHPDIPQYFRLKLLVPIFHGERPMGTLQAYNRDPGDFDSRDAELIANVADQLGPAMYRNWLHSEQERQISHLRSLDQLATSIAQFEAPDQLLERIADTGFEIADGDALTLWWVDPEKGLWPRLQRGATERVMISDAALKQAPKGASWLDADGTLVVWVRRSGDVIGALALRWNRLSLEVATRVETLELLASHAALASHQARLQDERDSALRRHFESEKLAGLGRLAAGVAHDFNNILAAILGRAQLLRRQITDPEHASSLAVIEQAALDGAGTVRRIQDFSRQAPQDRDQDAVADLDEVVRDTIAQTTGNWVGRAGGTVELDLQLQGGGRVNADPRELREVLTNLIHNALDAMTDGGRLSLSTHSENGEGLLRCGDDGCGIPAPTLERIFDPFFTTKDSGTGLGLAVSFGIVQRSGGRIEVDSVAGEGTRFTLRFPLALEPDSSDTAAPDRPTASPGGRVLVAEDDESVRELLVHILNDGGYEVIAAADGRECLKLVAQHHPVLVLTDLGMPELDGWGVAAALRRDHPEVKIGFITGWGATLDLKEARDAGASLVLAKPFRYEEVLQQVSKLLSQ
jgi:PAS domain S-box-containing protein